MEQEPVPMFRWPKIVYKILEICLLQYTDDLLF